LWYNQTMKKETLKESGKYILDLSKIVIAMAVITPFVKDSHFEIAPLIIAGASSLVGLYLINKGAKDE